MKKSVVFVIAIITCIVFSDFTYAYPITYNDAPLIDKSQTVQFLKDRNTSKKMLDCIDFVYEYAESKGIDPSIVMAISSIETGYGKSRLFVYNNNPGGIKARNGWAHYDTAKDGYRAMINLLATYAGTNNNTASYLYGKAKTTQQLGNYYWVENGCDAGYHRQLTRQIEKMRSYPVIKEKSAKKQSVKKQLVIEKEPQKKSTSHKEHHSGADIIFDILDDKEHSGGYDFIMNLLK